MKYYLLIIGIPLLLLLFLFSFQINRTTTYERKCIITKTGEEFISVKGITFNPINYTLDTAYIYNGKYTVKWLDTHLEEEIDASNYMFKKKGDILTFSYIKHHEFYNKYPTTCLIFIVITLISFFAGFILAITKLFNINWYCC